MPMRPRLGFYLVSHDIIMGAISPLTASAQSKERNYVLSRTMLDSAATAAVVSVNYYNGNGALTSDRNRGIANIDYDNLNNPTRIQFTDGSVTEYLYTAEGEKLMVTHTTAAPGISVAMGTTHHLTQNEILSTDSISYIGDLRICNGVPDMLRFGGGYISLRDKSTASPMIALHYYNYDHLGNVRDVVSEDGTVEQANDYYPFGATYGNGSSEDIQPYKYCGKELDRMYGLDTYDHGARQNYSILGVWDRIDPMAEKYYWISPYAVCGDNPINKIDPFGMDNYRLDDKTGYFFLMEKTNEETDRVLAYHFNKKNNTYEKNSKWYQNKIRINNIQKGILRDGINFKVRDNIISVGDFGQPSLEGIKSFVLQLSETTGVEISGYSYSSVSGDEVTDVLINKYMRNSYDKSYGSFNPLNKKYRENFSVCNILEDFHTHPDGKLGATMTNPMLSTDVINMHKMKKYMPRTKFIVLYRCPGQEIPEEYNYTNN